MASGRSAVRAMTLSIRASSRWLIAAALAAASQIPTPPAANRVHGQASPGWIASSMPMTAVNTISATTRGLVSAQYCGHGEAARLMRRARARGRAG